MAMRSQLGNGWGKMAISMAKSGIQWGSTAHDATFSGVQWGTPPIWGIPSGIRLTLADSITNIAGHKFEKYALAAANKIRKGNFSSKTIHPIQTNL